MTKRLSLIDPLPVTLDELRLVSEKLDRLIERVDLLDRHVRRAAEKPEPVGTTIH